MQPVVEASKSEHLSEIWGTSIQGSQWFAAFTVPNHEKRVAQHCQHRLIESFLPLYTTKHRWKNRRTVILERPLFPGYLFVRIPHAGRVRVLEVPGVVSIVSSGNQLLPLPDNYVANLREGLQMNKIEPHANVNVGEIVRIVRGAFAGAEGILERRKNDLRVVLRLEMLARSVSVEVDSSEIEGIRRAAWAESSRSALSDVDERRSKSNVVSARAVNFDPA